MFNVRETCKHFFGSHFEAIAAYLIHRKEAECLREWNTVRTRVQKFNLGVHLPQNGSHSHFTECSRSNRPFHQQSRSPCQGETLNDTDELLLIDCEECFLLVRDTDSRWPVLEGLVDLSRHCREDYNRLKGSQHYLSVSAKTFCCWLRKKFNIGSGVLSKNECEGDIFTDQNTSMSALEEHRTKIRHFEKMMGR